MYSVQQANNTSNRNYNSSNISSSSNNNSSNTVIAALRKQLSEKMTELEIEREHVTELQDQNNEYKNKIDQLTELVESLSQQVEELNTLLCDEQRQRAESNERHNITIVQMTRAFHSSTTTTTNALPRNTLTQIDARKSYQYDLHKTNTNKSKVDMTTKDKEENEESKNEMVAVRTHNSLHDKQTDKKMSSPHNKDEVKTNSNIFNKNDDNTKGNRLVNKTESPVEPISVNSITLCSALKRERDLSSVSNAQSEKYVKLHVAETNIHKENNAAVTNKMKDKWESHYIDNDISSFTNNRNDNNNNNYKLQITPTPIGHENTYHPDNHNNNYNIYKQNSISNENRSTPTPTSNSASKKRRGRTPKTPQLTNADRIHLTREGRQYMEHMETKYHPVQSSQPYHKHHMEEHHPTEVLSQQYNPYVQVSKQENPTSEEHYNNKRMHCMLESIKNNTSITPPSTEISFKSYSGDKLTNNNTTKNNTVSTKYNSTNTKQDIRNTEINVYTNNIADNANETRSHTPRPSSCFVNQYTQPPVQLYTQNVNYNNNNMNNTKQLTISDKTNNKLYDMASNTKRKLENISSNSTSFNITPINNKNNNKVNPHINKFIGGNKEEDENYDSAATSNACSAIKSNPTRSPSPMNPQRGKEERRVFVFTGLTQEEMQTLSVHIHNLGHDSSVVETCLNDVPPEYCTHIVLHDTPRSVKGLCGLVSGK